MPQPLEGRAGLGLGEELPPQQRAGDELHDALALQEIEQDHHRDRGGEGKRGWSEEVHGACRLRKSRPLLRHPTLKEVAAVQDFLRQVGRDVVVLVRRLEAEPRIVRLQRVQFAGGGEFV